MRIDIFAHILPRPLFERMFAESSPFALNMQNRVREIPCMVDLDERFRIMDRFAGYCQVLSLASPPIEALAGPGTTPQLASLANDALADLVTRHPERFPAFVAALPMNAPQAAIRELEHAIDTLGARGVQVYTGLDSMRLAPAKRQLIDEGNARRLLRL